MVIVRIWEGLGNQMFQYAYARALSRMGQEVCLDLNKSYDEFFPRDKRQENRDVAIHNFNITLEGINVESGRHYGYLKRSTIMEQLIFEMSKRGKWFYNFWDESDSEEVKLPKGNCYVKGWFQDPSYFHGIRDILLKEFTPKKKIKITKGLRGLLQGQQAVSVHIRRGDYVSIHNTLNLDYYEKALEEMKKHYPSPVFIVFSDDWQWAKQHLDLGNNGYYIDEKECLEDYEQLMVMSCCKANIIANSTFSWWAAWLNRNTDKIVIMPRRWLRGQERLMMKEWLVM